MHQPIIPHDAQVERYQIRVQGQLDPAWSEWLGGLEITWDGDGNSVLTGSVVDQTALHGLLARVRDLGLPLLALRRLATPAPALRAPETLACQPEPGTGRGVPSTGGPTDRPGARPEPDP